MSKAPAFQFYAADFLVGTSSMTCAEVGIYIRLLCHQWDRGGLPNDPEALAKLAMIHSDGLDSTAIAPLMAKFQQCEDGLLRNERLAETRANLDAYFAKKREAGRKGAKNRWQTHSSAIADPSVCQWQNDGSSSSNKEYIQPTLDEWKAEAARVGLSEGEAETSWNNLEAVGWVSKHGQPIRSWRRLVVAYRNREQEFNQQRKGRNETNQRANRGGRATRNSSLNDEGHSDYASAGKV